MKFIKRTIALMLSLLMTMCGVYADKPRVVGLSGEYSDRMKLISYLGIADSTSESEATETEVLRGEFAINVAKMLNLSTTDKQTDRYFIDVPKDHWAVGAINVLVGLKIVSVGDDKCFRPEEPITDVEALKMVMTATGYGDRANADGGFPYGYTKVARTAGMSDFSSGSNLTFAKAIDLLYEGLTIPLYDISVFGESKQYEQATDNILSAYYDLYTDEGIITYTDGIALDNLSTEDVEYVRIDGEKYKTDIIFLSYIGQKRSFVYKKDKNSGEKEVVLLNSENKNEKTIVIDRDDFREYSDSDNRVVYYDKDKSRSVRISNSASAVKNGELLKNDTSSAFDFNKGTITLIDVDENGEYDYILTFEYKNYVVDRIESLNKVVYDKTKFSNSINLDESKDNRKIIIEKGGVRVGFDAIQQNDVLTVYESNVFVRAIITSNQITGNLYKISTDENTGAPKLNIGKNENDGTDYVMDKDYFKDVIKDTSSMPIGGSATYYTDVFGKIAYIQYTSGLPWQYAYLMNYSIENVFETVVKLKVLLQNGTVGTYEIADKVKIDGTQIKDSSKILSSMNKSKYTLKGQLQTGEDEIKGQLIRVKINADNKITEIDTEYIDSAAETSQSLKRTAKMQTLYYRYYPQSFDGKFVKNANTVCFIVPKYASMSDAEDKKFRVIPATSSHFNDKNHTLEGFKLEQNGGAEDVLVIYEDLGDAALDSSCYLVDSITETITSAGDITKAIHVLGNGTEYDLIVDSNYDLSVDVTENGITKKYMVGEGDIIQIAADFDNVVTNTNIVYDFSRRNDSDYNPLMGSTYGNYYGDRDILFHAYVKNINEGIVMLKFSKPTADEYINNPQEADYIAPMSGNSVIVYDTSGNKKKVYKGSLSDLVPADKAGSEAKPYFLTANKGIITGAIIYR